MKIFYLVKVSIEKSFKELIRYKFNTIANILSLYVLFIAMFYGVKVFGNYMNVSPIELGETMEGFVIGYFLWTIMLMVYENIAYSISKDANTGTLEQISMTDMGFRKILIVRSICDLVINLIVSFIILVFIMATTGYQLNINVGPLLLLIILGIFSMFGISLIFGGLALIFKKVQSFLNIIQYFFIAILVPTKSMIGEVGISLIPFRPAIDKVYDITLGGQKLYDFPISDYIILIANSAIYFIIGLIVFEKCSKVARKKGLLGQY
ncbi:ABC transporter permease [Vallitalea longa]|nr:ABC transporter permease [Vallitalea longa]